MDYFRFYRLLLIAIVFGCVYCEEAEKAKADERFLDLDDLFDGFDVKVKELTSQGSQAMQTVKEIKGQHGNQFTKTVITHTFTSSGSGMPGNFPVGDRFKRSLFDTVVRELGNAGSGVRTATDKLAGALADGVNITYEGMEKIKDKIKDKLEN